MQPTKVVRESGGCLFFQPAQATSSCTSSGLRKVSKSTVNCSLLFPFTVTLRRSHDACINQRIDSLPCPALFSIFPGRQAGFAQGRTPSSAGADSTKPQRPAWPGSNYVCIRWDGWWSCARAEWDVVEYGRDRGAGECVIALRSTGWATEGTACSISAKRTTINSARKTEHQNGVEE